LLQCYIRIFLVEVKKSCDNITTILFHSFFTFVVKVNKLCYNYMKVLFQVCLVFIARFCFNGAYVSLSVVKEHKLCYKINQFDSIV
jgi:hypothetical protein